MIAQSLMTRPIGSAIAYLPKQGFCGNDQGNHTSVLGQQLAHLMISQETRSSRTESLRFRLMHLIVNKIRSS